MSANGDLPFVTLVLPALDEEGYLERCVRSLVDGGHPVDRLELLVIDGGSGDGTRAIAERLAAEMPYVRVADNPGRLQSAAFNAALRLADARSTYLIRCDVHAEYPPGFVSRAVASARDTGAALVAFRAASAGLGCFQTAVAFAQNTPVGVGDSRYRLSSRSGWVDHGMHGCFLRSAVEAVGGYDESFSHNEDAELSHRLTLAGGRIWLDSELAVRYFPRDTLPSLARQYWHYGRGRASNCLKHGAMPRPRQLAPAVLVSWHVAALAVASRRPAVLALPAAYVGALTAVSLSAAVRRREACLLLAPPALATMHHAWGAGFLSRVAGSALSRIRSTRTAPRP
jgi:succinoglycan biosynthesis protein ExoA